MGLGAMIFIFWMLSFKKVFLLSSFTLIKRLFNSSLLSTMSSIICISEVVDVFLLAIFISANIYPYHNLKITADGDCSHEIKRCLLLGMKVMTNWDSILKSRDITLPTKVHLVKAMVSPVVLYGCESWTIKKAECRRISTFELWCWRRLLRVPWTARRSNQSVLKEMSPGCSLEGMML